MHQVTCCSSLANSGYDIYILQQTREGHLPFVPEQQSPFQFLQNSFDPHCVQQAQPDPEYRGREQHIMKYTCTHTGLTHTNEATYFWCCHSNTDINVVSVHNLHAINDYRQEKITFILDTICSIN